LEGALLSLYGNYEKSYRRWEEQGAGTPPVFIVVCNNTNVSKMVFDWIAGWVKNVGTNGATPVVPGHLPILSNESEGTWLSRPNTLLIDSAQLESGQAMDEAFKKLIATEIEEVKSEFRLRFPGRDVDLTDEDLLREVINTVGKPGKLGEQVKCVVSVSMLTEGWDANTVTHILGVRAFGTQLLCEQVVGRGLRRISYEADANGMFDPEYAEVYGVPFSFIPTAGTNPDPKPPKPVHRVRAMKDRIALEITYPRVTGYRYDLPAEHLDASFSDESHLALSAEEMPLRTELRGIAGETQTHTLDELKARRLQEIGFAIAKLTLDQYLPDADGSPRPWLFPQLVAITQRWMSECVTCKDSAFLQMLWIGEYRHLAAERIQRALVEGTRGEKRLLPILRGYEPLGSTQNVTFDTTKAIYETDPRKCHLNYVTLDSNWEAKMAQALEWCDEVVCYVKNQGLGFTIPYVFEGDAASYVPDYIVRWDRGGSEPLNLVLEVSGEAKKAKAAKVATAETLWVPAVNNHGGFGRWGFIDIRDPYDAINLVRAKFARVPEVAGGKIGAEA
jgi:type III restriction enzyme